MNYLKFFKNKKILITGHTGFKGSWLIIVLSILGAKLYGISESYVSKPSMFQKLKLKNRIIKHYTYDIANLEKFEKNILEIKPDIIMHLAAQALVFESYKDPLKTIFTNTIGTVNLLEILNKIKFKCSILLVTSDKVYKNIEKSHPYFENDEIFGTDPYSASKSMAEIAINSYISSFLIKKKNIRIGIARAGNVIGGGDWAKNRIVPDCFKSWALNKPLFVRSPNSTRPWQHVLEPIFGYLLFVYKLSTNKKVNGEAFNFGPNPKNNYSVIKLINHLGSIWKYNKIKIDRRNKFHESRLLNISSIKAKKILGWKSIMNFSETAEFTTKWYNNYYFKKKENMYDFSVKQINEYIKKIS